MALAVGFLSAVSAMLGSQMVYALSITQSVLPKNGDVFGAFGGIFDVDRSGALGGSLGGTVAKDLGQGVREGLSAGIIRDKGGSLQGIVNGGIANGGIARELFGGTDAFGRSLSFNISPDSGHGRKGGVSRWAGYKFGAGKKGFGMSGGLSGSANSNLDGDAMRHVHGSIQGVFGKALNGGASGDFQSGHQKGGTQGISATIGAQVNAEPSKNATGNVTVGMGLTLGQAAPGEKISGDFGGAIEGGYFNSDRGAGFSTNDDFNIHLDTPKIPKGRSPGSYDVSKKASPGPQHISDKHESPGTRQSIDK